MMDEEPFDDAFNTDPQDEQQQTIPAEPFVRKAEKIALHLHHRDLRIAHLLLALVLTPRARDYFTPNNLEADIVRRCCWRALEGVPPEPEMAFDVLPSQEINELFGHAASFSNGRELEVSHILRAVNDVKLVGQYGPLLRNPGPRPEDLDAKVSEIRSRVAGELPAIVGRLNAIEIAQVEIGAKVGSLQESVGSRIRERDLHTALDVLRAYTTTLKYIVIISAISLAFVVAMIRVLRGP